MNGTPTDEGSVANASMARESDDSRETEEKYRELLDNPAIRDHHIPPEERMDEQEAPSPQLESEPKYLLYWQVDGGTVWSLVGPVARSSPSLMAVFSPPRPDEHERFVEQEVGEFALLHYRHGDDPPHVLSPLPDTARPGPGAFIGRRKSMLLFDVYHADPIMRFFAYEHLPVSLQQVSKACAALAIGMDAHMQERSEERKAGLRKLLEAKDCFVRAMIERKEEIDQLVDG